MATGCGHGDALGSNGACNTLQLLQGGKTRGLRHHAYRADGGANVPNQATSARIMSPTAVSMATLLRSAVTAAAYASGAATALPRPGVSRNRLAAANPSMATNSNHLTVKRTNFRLRSRPKGVVHRPAIRSGPTRNQLLTSPLATRTTTSSVPMLEKLCRARCRATRPAGVGLRAPRISSKAISAPIQMAPAQL